MVYTVDIINELNLFWQYPARTEENFYLQNKDDENFIGLPWATIHDKKIDLNQGFFKLMTRIQKNKEYYTCCQHIAFYKFITIWKALGIKKVYISHKRRGVDIVDNITLLPMPLYAVNIEDTNFNKEFRNIKDKLTIEKPYLYSFIGGYQQADYMSSIRPNIFKMQHPDNTFIKNTGVWHLDKLVFGSKQNICGELYKTKEHDIKTGIYNEVLKKSRFSLCPSGSGPNSIRLWESLAIGSIPVLLSDTLELPYHELWCDAILEVKEKDLLNIPDILDNISPDKERKMRENCIKIYEDFKNNYKEGKRKKIDFKINIPINFIDSYFKVFGHFFGDHFFQIFKIKKWYEKEYNKEVENIFINNYSILLNKAPFVEHFYKCLFKNINIKTNNEIVNLNVVLGSVINSEKNYLYYLSHTSTLSNIPKYILDNVRKPTKFNKVMGIELQELILNKLDINVEDKLDYEILIINRKNSRKLLQLDSLCNHLTNNNYKYNIVCFEDYNLCEQIKLVRSYSNVIVACGSVQVHISFMKKNSKWIELCESGFRYPNTSVYGNRYKINTYTLCSPLTNDLNYLRNINNYTQKLFDIGDKYPNIITNCLSDIEREVSWYTTLLTPLCIHCYGELHKQDILCDCYIDNIIKILNNN